MTTAGGTNRPPQPKNPFNKPQVLYYDPGNNSWGWMSPALAQRLQVEGRDRNLEFHGIQPPAASLERLRGAFSTGAGPVGSSFSGSNRDESTLFGMGNSYRDAQTNLRNNQRWAQTWAAQGPQYNEQRSPTGANNPFWQTAQEYQQRIADLERERDAIYGRFNQPQLQEGLAAGPSSNMLTPPEDVATGTDLAPAQQAPVLTIDQILEAYRRGSSRADTVSALLDVPMSADEVDDLLGSIDRERGQTQGGKSGEASGIDIAAELEKRRKAETENRFGTLEEQFGNPFTFRQFLGRQMPDVAGSFRGFAERQLPFLQTAMSLGQLAGQEHPSFESFLESTGGARPSASQFQDLLRQGAGVFGVANPTAAQQAGLSFFQDLDPSGRQGVSEGLARQFQAGLQSRQLGIAPMFRESLGNLANRRFEDWLAQTRGQEEFLPGFVNRGFIF